MASSIVGCGSYLPNRIITNAELVEMMQGNTSEEWITSRTGIKQRHIAASGEYSSHMALSASLAAIKDSGIDKAAIDLIIVCTTTPDNSFPSTAAKLQGMLSLGSIPAFDLQAVCAGFVYGLHVADSMMRSGCYKTILLVGVDRMSSLLDWNDRSTAVLFGDGAGAVILQKTDDDSGILGSIIYADGSNYDILYTNGGVASSSTSGVIKMSGGEVFRHAVQKLSDVSVEILGRYNLQVSEIDYFIPHQANIRIIDNVAIKLAIAPEKIIKTVDHHANCSAASVPLALAELKQSGRLRKGDLILSAAIGAGLTWGGALIRW